MELTGIEFWTEYLDDLYQAGRINELTRDDMLREFDGYEMTWTFKEPTMGREEGNLDGACIYGDGYVDGGFCAGL